MKSPIFLFSLPRSGSTLLQRILMSHKDIASVAEPWFLLPFCYAYKKEGILSVYSHYNSYKAVEDFINNLPEKEDDYYSALKIFSENLYSKQCKSNEKYFLDKTPRYYNIIPEIYKTFPDAKFIFLFRNPVHVFASIINTWCDGRLKCLYKFEFDLNNGMNLLSEGYKLLKDKSFVIQYEKFVKNPEKYTQKICEYLEIDFDENMLLNFTKQTTKGRMGDPTGVKIYNNINASTLNKWKKTFNNSYRKNILFKYISNLEEEILSIQGYDKQEIMEEVKMLKSQKGFFIKDRLSYAYSNLMKIMKFNIWIDKRINYWSKKQFLD